MGYGVEGIGFLVLGFGLMVWGVWGLSLRVEGYGRGDSHGPRRRDRRRGDRRQALHRFAVRSWSNARAQERRRRQI